MEQIHGFRFMEGTLDGLGVCDVHLLVSIVSNRHIMLLYYIIKYVSGDG